MKCEITVGWHNGNDDMTLCREKEPEEVWGVGGPRNIIQAIDVLDQTYMDVRAALVVMLPLEVGEKVDIVAKMTVAQAQARGLGPA